MPRNSGSQAAEGLDYKYQQDRLRSAKATFQNRGTWTHEYQSFAQGFQYVIGQEKEKNIQRQQERLSRFPFPDVDAEP